MYEENRDVFDKFELPLVHFYLCVHRHPCDSPAFPHLRFYLPLFSPPVPSTFIFIKSEAYRGFSGSFGGSGSIVFIVTIQVTSSIVDREIVRFSRISPTLTSEPSYFPSRDRYPRLLLSTPISYIYDNI